LALAESIVAVLSEKSGELGICSDVEALLRASIAATTYGINRYLVLLSGAPKSEEAAAFVARRSGGVIAAFSYCDAGSADRWQSFGATKAGRHSKTPEGISRR